MESKLIKAFAYSFTLALLVAIIYFPDTQTLISGDGIYEQGTILKGVYI